MSRLSSFSGILVLLLGVTLHSAAAEVNVYSARKEALIKPLLDRFSAKTAIRVNLITANADKLLTRIINEGHNTPADLFITSDAGRLYRAKQAGVLQRIESAVVAESVPAHLRDIDGFWVGLSQRARVIYYAADRVKPEQLSRYEDLASPEWEKRICIRSSNNIYNQSMVASMIAAVGEAATLKWVKGLVHNFARKPQGGDRDQIKAAAAGQCDVAIVNSYYHANMLADQNDPSQQQAAAKMTVFWPNQSDRGAHVNVSGAGILRDSKNREDAIRLLEFLLSAESQRWYAEVNYEFPVVDQQAWGGVKTDLLNLSRLGELNAQAVKIMDKAGWR